MFVLLVCEKTSYFYFCSGVGASLAAVTAHSAECLLEYNHISDCRDGVSVWSDEFASNGAEIALTGNKIYRCAEAAVLLSGARVHARLVGNEIFGNEQAGVRLLQAARLSWKNNSVHDNNGPPVIARDHAFVELDENNLFMRNRSIAAWMWLWNLLGLENLTTSTWFLVLIVAVFALQVFWRSHLQPLFEFRKYS